MAAFPIAHNITIGYEGGFNRDLGDGKGWTYRGITMKDNPQWPGWKIIKAYDAKHRIKDEQVIADAALEKMVADFYRNKLWNPITKGEGIKSQPLANFIHDWVTHGKYHAVKLISDALRQFSAKPLQLSNTQLTQDAINFMNAMPAPVYRRLWLARYNDYDNQTKPGARNHAYRNNFMNRIKKFPSSI